MSDTDVDDVDDDYDDDDEDDVDRWQWWCWWTDDIELFIKYIPMLVHTCYPSNVFFLIAPLLISSDGCRLCVWT